MERLDNFSEDQKYIRAKKRVEELKAYYWHLAAYIIVNIFLSTVQIIDGITESKTFTEIFYDFGIYGVWLMWGIGLAFHTLKIFGFPFFMGKDWEDRKINEYMNDKR
jgi:hypothetical protein